RYGQLRLPVVDDSERTEGIQLPRRHTHTHTATAAIIIVVNCTCADLVQFGEREKEGQKGDDCLSLSHFSDCVTGIIVVRWDRGVERGREGGDREGDRDRFS